MEHRGSESLFPTLAVRRSRAESRNCLFGFPNTPGSQTGVVTWDATPPTRSLLPNTDYSPSRGSSSYQTQVSVPRYSQEQLRDGSTRSRNVLANTEQKPESPNHPAKTHNSQILPCFHRFGDTLEPFPPLARALH